MAKKNYPAQSKDFKEIQNTQTEMTISDRDWDKIFHNPDPKKCPQRKLARGCTICQKLEKRRKIIKKLISIANVVTGWVKKNKTN